MKNAVYVGMGGWELPSFNKYFYPPKKGKGFRKLEFYSSYFDCVEVNSTFYNTSLSSHHSARWLQDVVKNWKFQFIVKLFRGFTHLFNANKNDVLAVHRLLEPLHAEGRLAGLIMQFPYSFTNLKERRDYLVQLSKIFRPHRLFVEVRHGSWNQPYIRELLDENGLNMVNVDLPRVKQHIPLTENAYGGVSFFRLMGRNAKTWDRPWRVEENKKYIVSDRYNYFYSSEELHELFRRIEKVRVKADSTFVIFHTDPQAHSLVNGFQLRHLIEKKSKQVLAPQHILKSYPQLNNFCKPISQSFKEETLRLALT
ncbi:MAG: DUF72 domain-containing protein [Ignavibacteriales bacterium]|nr:DUF72 domain-containing protein [Ignavibacteriales bacterium]